MAVHSSLGRSMVLCAVASRESVIMKRWMAALAGVVADRTRGQSSLFDMLAGSPFSDFLIPGLIGMNLMGSGIWGLGFAIVDARRGKLFTKLARHITVAAKEAKLGANYSVVEFPEKKSLIEGLSEALSGEKPPLVKHDLGSRVAAKVMENWRWLSSFDDPRGVYARLGDEPQAAVLPAAPPANLERSSR